MLEQMMRAVARKIIAQEYPHAKSPAVVYATVSKATQLGETFDDMAVRSRGSCHS